MMNEWMNVFQEYRRQILYSFFENPILFFIFQRVTETVWRQMGEHINLSTQ